MKGLVLDLAEIARMGARRCLAWLLWSPLRLFGTLAVSAVATVALITAVTPSGTTPTASDPSFESPDDLPSGWQSWPYVDATGSDTGTGDAPAPAGGSDQATVEVHDGTDTEGQTSASPAIRREVTKVARRFFVCYFADPATRKDKARERWRQHLKPTVSPGMFSDLKTVDPRNVQPGQRKGPLRVKAVSDTNAIVWLRTRRGVWAVALAPYGSKWVVSRVQPPEPKRPHTTTKDKTGTPAKQAPPRRR